MTNFDKIRAARQMIAKSQPTASDVHIDRALYNIFVAYVQAASNFVADQVFPIVPVDKQSNLIFASAKEDWMRNEAGLRAPSTESTGGAFNIDHNLRYFCNVYSHHFDVDDFVRTNSDEPIDLDRFGTEYTTQMLLIKREVTFMDNYFTGGVWDKTYTGVSSSPVPGTSFYKWSDYGDSDPIGDIRSAKTFIKQQTGFEPNVLLLSYDTYAKLVDHPDIVARLKITQDRIVQKSLLAALFDLDRVVISGAVENTAAEGAAPSTSDNVFIANTGALLTYAAPNPSIMNPSGGYIFAWKGITGITGFTAAVRKFRLEQIRSDRIESEMAFDTKLIRKDLGAFFQTTV